MRILSWILLVSALAGFNVPARAQDPCDQVPVFTSGETVVCQGSSHTFTVSQFPGAVTYIWAIDGWPPIQESADTSITIEWGPHGTSELCVVAMCSSAQVSPPSCLTIEVTPAPRTVLDTLFVCAEDTMVAGNKPGVYEVLLVTPEGCDSFVTLTIALYPEGPADLGTIYLCDGDYWELNGTAYTDPGSYTVEGDLPFPPWCYREMTFRIEPITDSMVSIKTIPSKQQNALPTLLPTGLISDPAPDLIWSGPNGFESKTKSIQPTETGDYCLEVRYPLQSDSTQSCVFQHCVDVHYPLPPDSDEEPGGFDPDHRSAGKPWIYPQPASDEFCIAWPGNTVTAGSYTLYNRWGAPVQSGALDQVCTALNPLPPDVYILVLIMGDGSVSTSLLNIL